MVKTLMSIKIDADTKKKAQRKAKYIGMPLSTIVNAYIKDFVRSPTVTFPAEPNRLKPEVENDLIEAYEDYKKGRNVVGPFSNAEAMDKYLDGL
jgi:antitoxin component of RelBE/YafQ-DinJ toxin-antitoxin module